MRNSAEQVPFSHGVDPGRDWKPVASSNGWSFVPVYDLMSVIRAVGHDLALFSADFHSVYRCSIYESVGEVLKFTTAAARTIDVVGESRVACVRGCGQWRWMVGCFLHDLLRL